MIKTDKITSLGLALSLTLLAGCSHNTAGDPPYHFGNAVEQNIAAQVIDPDAPAVNEEPIYNGTRMTLAQKRYETDKAETPEATTTSALSYTGAGK